MRTFKFIKYYVGGNLVGSLPPGYGKPDNSIYIPNTFNNRLTGIPFAVKLIGGFLIIKIALKYVPLHLTISYGGTQLWMYSMSDMSI